MNAGAAIPVVAPVSLTRSLTRAEPGANSASAESARIEKAEATESCLDIVRTRYMLRCTNSVARFFCNAVTTDCGANFLPAVVPARLASAYRNPMLSNVLTP
jgi:hypothetical protein